MIEAAELAVLLRRDGPQQAGAVSTADGAVVTAAAPAFGQAARDLAAGWSTRMALTQTLPAPPEPARSTLVLSHRDALVLAERVEAGVRRRSLLHVAHLTPFLQAATSLPVGTGDHAPAVPDHALDPAAVAAGMWEPAVAGLLATAQVAYEAVVASAGESSRADRPMLTCLVGDGGVVCLEARPAGRSLTFRHRDAAGAAELLTGLLLAG